MLFFLNTYFFRIKTKVNAKMQILIFLIHNDFSNYCFCLLLNILFVYIVKK